jgi:single-strand DNA-binding protein
MPFNKVVLVGRLTDTPDLRETANGTSVINFTLAVDRSYGEEKQTDFIPVVAWKGIAETIFKYCDKGSQILVCGQLQTRKWEDKDGNKRSTTEVLATEFTFCEGKRNSEDNSSTTTQKGSQAKAQTAQLELVDTDDDFPF